jgi:tetratricopeptide (TPR) repeat protein
MKAIKTIRNTIAPAILGIGMLIFTGCSSSTPETEVDSFSQLVGQHAEETGEGNIITKIYEERKNGVYAIKIQVIKEGQISETIHYFDNSNFTISIPVSARIMVQSPEQAEKSPNTSILVFSQKLEVARDAMMKTDYVAALEALNEALKIDSYNPQAHMMKGSIFYAMGKYDLANKEFDFVLKVDPGNIEVKRFKEFMDSQSEGQKVKIEGIEGQ